MIQYHTRYMIQETLYKRHDAIDRRHETGDVRQETSSFTVVKKGWVRNFLKDIAVVQWRKDFKSGARCGGAN